MNKLKFQIKLSFRVELFGTGFYRTLSKQYNQKYPTLSKMLDKAAAQEYGHSKLFNACYHELFNKKLGAEKFWLGFGSSQSYLIFALPLSLKLKLAKLTELLAVKQFERDISSGDKNKYIEIVKKILPDEKDHAEIYCRWNKSKN
jgi:rubrerythrin